MPPNFPREALAPPAPDYLLERYARGELPAAEADALRARLGDALEPALLALRQSDEEILAAHPPARVAAAIRQRQSRAEPSGVFARPIFVLLPATACALALAFWLLPSPPAELAAVTPTLEPTRIKGLAPTLRAYRAVDGAAQLLEPGTALGAGALVQLSYAAAGAQHGTVLSIDGRGSVTLHWPASPGPAAALEPSGAHALPQAFELDDAPEFERFFLITSEKPFDVAPVLESARRLALTPAARAGTLRLPAGLKQSSLLLRKVSP